MIRPPESLAAELQNYLTARASTEISAQDYLVVYQGLDEDGARIEEEVHVLCLVLYEIQ